MTIHDYEDPDKLLDPDDYKRALESQSACNLSGIVHTFSEVLSKIWVEANARGLGTDWVNQHPISVLYSTQIASLSGASTMDTNYFAIDEFCRMRGGMGMPNIMKESTHEA
jgi:hypothetical protein